ncbi:MAG TPA: carboxypeptidase-like regulatory domain-containing protein [Bacteroidia bacterium]|nr:carboxypeptidase-like regulatory domain-containing protein [Bacteroidia bacterium]
MKKSISNNISLAALLFVSIVFLTSCKCKKDTEVIPTYTLSGRVFSECNLPLANAKISFHQDGESTLVGTSESNDQSTVTDANGYFSIAYENNGSNPIEIWHDAKKMLSGIPIRQDINDIVGYKNARACIQVKLNVLNPHSSADTLNITNFASSTPLSLVGPFTSQVLYTAPYYSILEPTYYGAEARVLWNINSYTGVFNKTDFKINKYCNDTIFVTATIN